MKPRIAMLLVLSFAGCLTFVGEARAQFPVTGIRPTISPYLNLLRRDGGGIGFQYYMRVLPEREFRNNYRQQALSLSRLNRRVRRLEQPSRIASSSGLNQTGHATRFQSFGGYYRSGGSRSSGSRSGPRNR